MEAVTWTAMGILAAFSLGVLALQVTQAGRFDSVNARFDSVNARIDSTAEAHSAELRELRQEIRALGDRLERRLEDHEARHG